MTKTATPNSPERELPSSTWEHYDLYKSTKEAVASLPVYFRTETSISGIMATDLHTLNSVLGAAIEEQVVRTLNHIRGTWDPNEEYALFSFIRQPQTFPDVRLKVTASEKTLLGIELKGWYLLAKEAEPSLRFQTASAACAPQDLIVVVPWALSNVISGSPVLFQPYIESAKYTAEYRNYHWKHLRKTKADSEIDIASDVEPYPSKTDHISDKPKYDGGGNFGRIARTGIMNDYMAKLDDTQLCGIKVKFWRQFLKSFQEKLLDYS